MIAPEHIVQQFRGVALERLGRVETAWARVLNELDDRAAAQIQREIHTLKGEACLVGFSDVNLICHKLEDLFMVARGRGFAVDDDFDLAVNMALRFMAMLVRKKAGAQLAGIDLPGFVREIDRVLADCGEATGKATSALASDRRAGAAERVPLALRPRLSEIAVDAFLEYASAKGSRRNRLRTSWHALRDLVGVHRAMIGAGQLFKYKASTRTLAQQLGKQVQLAFELDSAEVTTEVLATLDTAAMHLVRNAIDHGIELPEVRSAAGKPAAGKIVIRGGLRGERFELSVEDDGGGIAFAQVRRRAAELGLLRASDDELEGRLDDRRWLELLCHPGLSTRQETTDVSGRGIGLDAVRVAIVEAGGTLTMRSRPGAGTTWTIELPVASMVVDGHMFRAPDVPVPIVVDASWELACIAPGAASVVDLASHYGLAAEDPRNRMPLWFVRDGAVVGIAAERPPVRVQARKLVMTSAGVAEVVTVDGVEALVVRPQALIEAHPHSPRER